MKKVISYSLWGSDPLYTVGAIRNAEMNPNIFGNDWISRFYVGNDVPMDIVNKINGFSNTEIMIMYKENPDWTGMFWRFWGISDEDVDIIIFRDTDSRPSKRDALAVSEWVDSGKLVHVMRDHPYHTEPIMGGMWGCKAKETFDKLFNIIFGDTQVEKTMRHLIDKWIQTEKEKTMKVHILNQRRNADALTMNYMKPDVYFKKGIDQLFLRAVIYKALNDDIYIHDAFPLYNAFSGCFDEQRYFTSPLGRGCKKELSTGFPSARGDFEVDQWNDFIGQVYDENDIPNKEYAELLKQRDECIYMDWDKE